ncbi:MAG: RNA polymerase sigma factor [Patescibacteria group bacterium]|jgi:RNA polymerase sigma-70 factor (ECF subfamily)
MVGKIPEKTSDEKIVQLSLSDKENYLHLMRRYEPKLLRYIFRITNCSREDAEDILQEVFIKAYQNLNDFDQSLKFSSWIYRICHNEVISHWRKLNNSPKNVELFDNDIKLSSNAPIYKELDIKLNKEKIDEVLKKLPIKYRDVLVLRFFEEKDYGEIADILKSPLGTVGTLISRAKKVFKEAAQKNKINF